MRLIDAPVGIFRFHDELVLKTEYMTAIDDVYVPECYIVSTGEKFWGGMKSKDDFKTLFNDLEVEIVDIDPAPHWIPATEPPEKDGRYWVWAEISFVPDHVDEPNTFKGSTEASFLRGRWYGSHVEKVFAWMPLPAPYQEENDG